MNNKLSLFQAIPLGIGSIIGSGILFLPSLTYYTSEENVLLAWIITTILCIPGVIFFSDMVKVIKDDSGMAGFVSLGLGELAGNSIYLLMFGTVIFGMPSAAIIAGDYLESITSIVGIGSLSAYGLIILAIGINLKGIRSSANLSLLISVVLIVISVILLVLSSEHVKDYSKVVPTFNMMKTYSGVVLAFWAFAGFENLTFLYRRFENPQRDLALTILISILICGTLYIGLVMNYASIVPLENVKQTVGLLQISEIAGGRGLSILIGLFALFAVSINLISWTSGVSQLVKQSSSIGLLPRFLSRNEKKAEKRCIYFLGTVFLINLTIATIFKESFLSLLNLVSSNFLLIYILGLVSYSIFIKNMFKKVFSIFIALLLSLTMTSSGYLLIYPVVIILISSFLTLRSKSQRILNNG